MPQHHNISTTPPPVATWVQVFWWGENRWITVRFDGAHWRDELGRIVKGPIVYWREITRQPSPGIALPRVAGGARADSIACAE